MHRLYYNDSYLRQAVAHVTAIREEGQFVLLDETIFYPTSGGQPHDLGTINQIPVVDVVEEEDGVAHVLAKPLTGELAKCEILWPRRYDHMQQHTGQHLLSAVFEDLFQIPTMSFHMGEESSTIELATKELPQERIDAVVLRATELARTGLRIGVTFEDASEVQGLRKASARDGSLRIVEIPGVDRSACGGTHVASLAEVLPLQIREQERVRGNVRIAFVCGDRCVGRAQSDFRLITNVARALATPLANVDSQATVLLERLARSEKENQRLENEAAIRAGLDLYRDTPLHGGGYRRVLLSQPVIDDQARTKAKSFAMQSKAVLLLHSDDGILLACSSDSGINAGAILKAALAKVGARGGGSPVMAQGSLTDSSVLMDLKQVLGMASA